MMVNGVIDKLTAQKIVSENTELNQKIMAMIMDGIRNSNKPEEGSTLNSSDIILVSLMAKSQNPFEESLQFLEHYETNKI